MSTVTDKECKHLGELRGTDDREYELIHELGRRIGNLWGYDQSIANADGQPKLQEFWRTAKSQEQRNIDHRKNLIERNDSRDRINRERNRI